MATIRIIAEEGEDFETIEDELVKAFVEKHEDKQSTKRYDDPMMNVLIDLMDHEYREMNKKMFAEIIQELREVE